MTKSDHIFHSPDTIGTQFIPSENSLLTVFMHIMHGKVDYRHGLYKDEVWDIF